MKLGKLHERGCTTDDHTHKYGICCAPTCWCNQPVLRIKAVGAGLPTGVIVVHEPNEVCALEGWHGELGCPALAHPDGTRRPRNVEFLDGDGHWPDGTRL